MTDDKERDKAALLEYNRSVIEPLRTPTYWTIWKLAFQRGAEWNEAKTKINAK